MCWRACRSFLWQLCASLATWNPTWPPAGRPFQHLGRCHRWCQLTWKQTSSYSSLQHKVGKDKIWRLKPNSEVWFAGLIKKIFVFISIEATFDSFPRCCPARTQWARCWKRGPEGRSDWASGCQTCTRLQSDLQKDTITPISFVPKLVYPKKCVNYDKSDF